MRKMHQTSLLDSPAPDQAKSVSLDHWPPNMAAARARLQAVHPGAYARTRNALDGAVSGLSPYITHGMLSLSEALAEVHARHPLDVQHKWVYELGWRAFFHHAWAHRGDGIFQSIHEGPLPDAAYALELPADIAQACTGVPVIDQAVRTLYRTGYLHNHARMWLASYVVHVRKVHWRTGADWLHAHLLDGDLASNHLSWQWVAGTGSHKPYLFNAENVARYAPPEWHSPGTVLDTDYDTLDRLARSSRACHAAPKGTPVEPAEPPVLRQAPPAHWGFTEPDAHAAQCVQGREVVLVHPWCLGDWAAAIPMASASSADAVVVGVCVSEFHQAWPWSPMRWDWVCERMADMAPVRWHGTAAQLQAALRGACRVVSVAEPHLRPWLPELADCQPPQPLFPHVARPCGSFSQWWREATRGIDSVDALLFLSAG
jgi:deoxyribodipyrimidine photo-lyase